MTLSVTMVTGPLRQGEVGVAVVNAPSTLTSLEGEVFDRPVRFWPTATSTEWYGLVGVGAATTPGSHVMTLRGTDVRAQPASGRLSLVVEPRRFETRRLKVDPALVNPPREQAARIAQETKAMAEAFSTATPERLWRGQFAAPVPGTATSSFGRLTVMNGQPGGRHQGADFRAASGTPVHAPNAGRVVLAQDLYFAGNTVIVDHGLGVFSLLAHLSRIGVAVGDHVSRGDLLGESGATGRVTGPHLHWAVRFGDTSVDPISLMKAVASLPGDVPPISVQ